MSLRKKHKCIILKGFKLLMIEQRNYTQKSIVNKLDFLGYGVSRPLLNKLYKQKNVSDPFLAKVATGFCEIIAQELCMVFQENDASSSSSDLGDFVKTTTDCQAKAVPEFLATDKPPQTKEIPYTFHQKGRFFIHEKVDFIRSAQKEVYEVGVRLARFAAYFKDRSDEEFKTHVEALLAQGINFNCYLLNPDSNTTRLYFEDRAKLLPEEKNNVPIIQKVIQELLALQQEFVKAGYSGQLKVYTYTLIPNNSFFVVDPFSAKAKMAVSHYLHGSFRSKCPLLEFSKKDNPKLFALYLKSFKAVLSHAKEVTIP